MNNKMPWVLMVAAGMVAVMAGAAWYQVGAQMRHFKVRELESIAALLKEDQELLQALRTDAALEKDSGVLASYLSKIRADGLAKHADMKQRLDQLAENNTTVVALITGYSGHTRTPAFAREADKFRNYASAWRDRWNSLMELFMAGGNYAASGVPFPTAFSDAVRAEIAM